MPRSAAKRVDFGAGWSVTHQVTALPIDKDKLPELLGTGVFQKQTRLKRPDDNRAQEALRYLVDSPRRRAAVIINGATRSETLSASEGTYFVLHLDWEELLSYLRTPKPAVTLKEDGQCIGFGNISVDLSCMEVTSAGIPVPLTRMEFKMLRFLLEHPGQAISREGLLDQVWGYQHYPCTRTIDSHMLKLRQKLERDPANPRHFRTVHGVGYKFVP
jgi:DNA-binding response OmpR family regulator